MSYAEIKQEHESLLEDYRFAPADESEVGIFILELLDHLFSFHPKKLLNT